MPASPLGRTEVTQSDEEDRKYLAKLREELDAFFLSSVGLEVLGCEAEG